MVIDTETGYLCQVGFAFEPKLTQYTNPHYFFGYFDEAGYHETDSFVGPARGSTHTYKLQLEFGYWIGYADDAQIGATATAINGSRLEYFNEISSTTVPYIGTSSDKMKMFNVKYKNFSGSWVKPTLSPSNPSGSGLDWNFVSGGYWYSWDN